MKRSAPRAAPLLLIVGLLTAIVIAILTLYILEPPQPYQTPDLTALGRTPVNSPLPSLAPGPLISTQLPQDLVLQVTTTPRIILYPTQIDTTMIPAEKMTEIRQYLETAGVNSNLAQATEYAEATEVLRLYWIERTRLAKAVCSCETNTLDCSDFNTLMDAQRCYNYCLRQGKGDVHFLDLDRDWRACESR